MYSLAAKHLMMLSFKPHLATVVFIAAGSISQALGQAGGIINGFALIGAFAGLVFAGWAAEMGRTEMIIVLIAAFALALAGFRCCYDGLGLGTWVSLLVGATPLVVAMVYMMTLKLGKPKSYDVDFFRSFAVRLMRAIAGTGLLLIRFELHGLSARKTRHPYRCEKARVNQVHEGGVKVVRGV